MCKIAKNTYIYHSFDILIHSEVQFDHWLLSAQRPKRLLTQPEMVASAMLASCFLHLFPRIILWQACLLPMSILCQIRAYMQTHINPRRSIKVV